MPLALFLYAVSFFCPDRGGSGAVTRGSVAGRGGPHRQPRPTRGPRGSQGCGSTPCPPKRTPEGRLGGPHGLAVSPWLVLRPASPPSPFFHPHCVSLSAKLLATRPPFG